MEKMHRCAFSSRFSFGGGFFFLQKNSRIGKFGSPSELSLKKKNELIERVRKYRDSKVAYHFHTRTSIMAIKANPNRCRFRPNQISPGHRAGSTLPFGESMSPEKRRRLRKAEPAIRNSLNMKVQKPRKISAIFLLQ